MTPLLDTEWEGLVALSSCSFICQPPFSLHRRLELSTSSIPIFQMERLRHRAQPGCRRQVTGEAGLLTVWLLVAFKPVGKGTGGRRKIARCCVGKALSWMCVSPQLVLSLGHWKHWSGCHLALAGFIGSIHQLHSFCLQGGAWAAGETFVGPTL